MPNTGREAPNGPTGQVPAVRSDRDDETTDDGKANAIACRHQASTIEKPVTTWAIGDYPSMAERLEPAAVAAVDLADVQADDRVLDLATGTGNAALMAAVGIYLATLPGYFALTRQEQGERARVPRVAST